MTSDDRGLHYSSITTPHICTCISWRQHDEIMMMMSALHQTNTLSWIFIVLVH
jgi:hypothetical protein